MGVYTLYEYLRSHKDDLLSTMDLVALAKTYSKPMKIIADFHSWEFMMKNRFEQGYRLIYNNMYTHLYGGEYKLMDGYIKKLIANLREVNIELVFYLGAARGSLQDDSIPADELKLSWTRKLLHQQRRLAKCCRFLKGKIDFEDLGNVDIERPALQEVQNVLTLQEAGCELHMCYTGEMETQMALRLKEDSTAFCALSNNSDFCVFPECLWISPCYFDEGNDLCLNKGQQPEHGPAKLMCRAVRSDVICRAFKLRDHAALVELSIVIGNRFTKSSKYSKSLGEVSAMINRCRTLEKSEIGRSIESSEDFQKAVRRSRQYYKLQPEKTDHVMEPGDTYPLLVQGLKEGRLPSTLIAMYHGMYWHRMVLEDTTLTYHTADGVLSGLRAYLYSLILPPSRHVVREIGKGPRQILDTVHVSKITDIPIPTLAQVKASSFASNRRLFELIMQHQEEQFLDPGSSYFTVYGNRQGFLCYLLRYFLLMNWQNNLFLAPEEFFVLVAWTLTDYPSEECMRLKLVPSARCVTIQNWFLSLYRNVYAFLGNLLDLNHEFPAPKDLFSGSVWVALYTAVAVHDLVPALREPCPAGVSEQTLQKFSDLVRSVIKENRLMVKAIVRDVFPFGPKAPKSAS